jgi:Cft2 family RNA processing exonuclease
LSWKERDQAVRLTFLGGADEVGASCILVEAAGRRVLVDAGVRISPKARLGLAGDQLPDLSLIGRAGGVDVCLVTHAHTDHIGALPLVLERYPGCPVLTTPVTAALMRVLLYDAQRIMQDRLEQEGELPLFDHVAVEKLLVAYHPVAFHTRIPLADGLVATFYPAGHIAGAAMIGLESGEGRILISGDVSITPQRTVDGAKVPPFRPDALILESTYGGRLHANRMAEETRLVETIAEIVAGGGKVLIPAFALGRAQEVVLILNEFRRRGLLGAVPVWIDGMVRAVCAAYKGFPDSLPLALRERIEAGQDPFTDEHTRMVTSAAERNAVAWEPGAAVIVSSSGMLAGGPSRQYARWLAREERNAILLTGYQDEESPGRRLQAIAEQGEGLLRLAEQTVKVQCHIGTYSLSAHADEAQLVSLAETLDPQEIFLVHGDGEARESLAERLTARQRLVRRPQAGQSFELQYRSSVVIAGFSGIGLNKPLDLPRLWSVLEQAGGGYFTVDELARAWWGNRSHVAEMAEALATDDLYFVPDGHREGLYRARSAAPVAQSRERRAAIATLADPTGHLLLVRPFEGTPVAARCTGVGLEDLAVMLEPDGRPESIPPEHLIEDLGPADGLPDAERVADLVRQLVEQRVADLLVPDEPRSLVEVDAEVLARGLLPDGPDDQLRRSAVALALLDSGALRGPAGWQRPLSEAPARMEPNQALAVARAAFPAEAGLRKVGYRLADGVLVLTFDFPDAAGARYAEVLAHIPTVTGWQVEVTPEVNQVALGVAVRTVLPSDWAVIKGPSIHRVERRVAATVARPGDSPSRQEVEAAFADLTGYTLQLTLVDRAVGEPAALGSSSMASPELASPGGPAGEQWEINAAYGAIREALAGSSLYRTSLKGDQIVLAFISPQVGERFRDQIQTLSARIGWPLEISVAPNQGEILEVTRVLLAQAGWKVMKGPGLRVAEGEVVVTVTDPSAADDPDRVAVAEALQDRTGYRLVVEAAAPDVVPAVRSPGAAPGNVIEIPIARIQLSERQRAQPLDPEKTRRAVERARWNGGRIEPILVRRVGDGYRLIDGLRRLQVAQELGRETIPALVE